MGLQVIIRGADFSALNKGQAGLDKQYFQNGGLTNTTKRSAYTTFINKFVGFGFNRKFSYARIFFDKAQSDRLNILDPRVKSSSHIAEFVLDDSTRHTVNGWKGTTGGAFLYSNFKFPKGTVTKAHFHSFTTEAEANNNSSVFNCTIDPNVVPGNDIWLELRKSSTGGIQTIFERKSTGDSYLNAAGSPTGLFSFVADETTTKIYDGGTLKAQEARPSIPFVNGEQQDVLELTGSTTDGQFISTARTFFTGLGLSDWTASDEANLNTILLELRTALV